MNIHELPSVLISIVYCLLILVCAYFEQAEVQSRVTTLEEVSSRATKAEAWALQAEEVRDGLTTSLGLVTEGHEWMRLHSIGHIVETILDAPENATTVAEIYERARQAGFKAGYKSALAT
ncbi:hypothetical protein HanIR_Chr14g0700791 [Helianthus annuus]|nr:hypothetical protein HanIR_Chr14g0700791 [Helianthus annuus]